MGSETRQKLPQKRIKPARKQIVLDTIARHGVSQEDFFGSSRSKQVVDARIDAVNRLLKDGAYKEEAAHHMRRHYSFVLYHTRKQKKKKH